MADNSNFKSGYSEVNGLKMYYEIYGQGKPLVLIHGGGSTIETSFGRVIGRLIFINKIKPSCSSGRDVIKSPTCSNTLTLAVIPLFSHEQK